PALRNLLFGRLGSGALDDNKHPEREAASSLFVNQFTGSAAGGYVTLNAIESALIFTPPDKQIPSVPEDWFDRVQRLVRLARWTGIDILDLDLILRRVCGNKLDHSALRRLAILVDLRDRTGTALDILCGLFDEISGESALGAGDQPDTA